MFVAEVTVTSVSSQILAVISDVDEPSAAIDVRTAVFMSFVGSGGPTVINTFTVP